MIRQKINVVQVLPQWGPGGAERLALDLACNFDSGYIEPTIVSLYPAAGSGYERLAKEANIRLLYLDKKVGLDWGTPLGVKRLLTECRADVVHTHLYSLSYVLPASLLARIPGRVHTVHNIASKEVEGIRRAVWWVAFRKCGVVPVSISEEIRRTVQREYGPVTSPIIYNGVDRSRFKAVEDQRLRWRYQHGYDEGGFIFVNIARMFPAKNQALLLSAFGDVVRRCPHARLIIVGDGVLRGSLEKQRESVGVGDHVEFLGVRDDIPEVLNASDAMVLSSDWEGLPIAVLEGMAAGKPVIGTAVGGVPELIRDGQTGLLVPRGDGSRLAEAMAKMCRDRVRSERMGLEGRRAVSERFDIRETAKRYEELYRDLLWKNESRSTNGDANSAWKQRRV